MKGAGTKLKFPPKWKACALISCVDFAHMRCIYKKKLLRIEIRARAHSHTHHHQHLLQFA